MHPPSAHCNDAKSAQRFGRNESLILITRTDGNPSYGRGAGVGRNLGVGACLGVGFGLGVAVAVAVGVVVALAVGVGEGAASQNTSVESVGLKGA
jgi:hypothetical protein